jgi:phospho-N-acetylmuramoyl-pentapeptide-transferase
MLYWFVQRLSPWLAEHKLDWAFNVLYQVQFRALAAAGLSFLIVMLLGRRAIVFLRRLKVGDTGQTDAELLRQVFQSKANVPTMGGLLIVGAIVISTLLLADVRQFYVQVGLIVLLWLAALGGVDDWLKLTAARRGARSRQGLYSWEKLVFQLGLGLLVGLFVYAHGTTLEGHTLAHVVNIPGQKTYLNGTALENPHLLFLTKPAFITLAVLMVAGMSNAVNITDGMDGLAGGISLAVALALTALAVVAGSLKVAQYLLVPYVPYSDELAVVAGAMAGACLGFLWFNCSPAQVFMGDCGALALGGLIGYISIVIRQEFVVLLMCGFFLWEILSVVLQVGCFKITGGKRIFRVAPFHHHLHLSGWSEQQVVARAWIISILLVVVAITTIKLR